MKQFLLFAYVLKIVTDRIDLKMATCTGTDGNVDKRKQLFSYQPLYILFPLKYFTQVLKNYISRTGSRRDMGP